MSGLPAWAVKGARVVCVLDFHLATVRRDRGLRHLPKLNAVYEIAWAETDAEYKCAVIGLRGFSDEQGFDVRGFRPAAEGGVTDNIEAQIYHKRGLHQRASRKSRADA